MSATTPNTPYAPRHAVVSPGRKPERVVTVTAAMALCGLLLLLIGRAAAVPAGADASRHQALARPVVQATTDLTQLPGYAAPVGVPAAATNRVVPTKPVHAAKKAPATKAVISGLAANGIPNVALNAYRVAAARLAHVDPGCGIDWALLAGIGREESDHGRFAGARLNADGTSTPRIIGIPLNGHGTALILDTDHGRLDGDTVYDRAVGPMQFIPSTWAAYGTDANGDGQTDAFNVNDAALTAARYLCAAGGDLHNRAGQIAAVLAYNYSDQYLAQVLALADAYRTGVAVHGLPVGDTSGGLPPVSTYGGYVPPANPGPPTAAGASPKGHPAVVKPAAKPATGAPTGSTSATSGQTTSGQTTSGQTATGSAPASGSTATPATGLGSTTSPPPLLPLPPLPLPTAAPKPAPTPTKTCIVPNPLVPGQGIL